MTVADLRARAETDLDDLTLERILGSAREAVDGWAGASSAAVETFSYPCSEFISLARRRASITSVKERRTPEGPEVTLATTDYRAVGDYLLLRLVGGANPGTYWGAEVVVAYVPEVDTQTRDRVTLDLCLMDIEFSAYDSEAVGEWSGGTGDWAVRRAGLLAQLGEGRSLAI